jgi:KH domain-containing RNA-binding signal transduction-associated protein 3
MYGGMMYRFVSFQFNFVGKLLGPKGNSLKRLQEETMTKMAILGRGSMRDKQKVS